MENLREYISQILIAPSSSVAVPFLIEAMIMTCIKNFSSTGNARSHTTNTLSVAVAILLYHPCNEHISVDIIGRQCKRGQCDAAIDQV